MYFTVISRDMLAAICKVCALNYFFHMIFKINFNSILDNYSLSVSFVIIAVIMLSYHTFYLWHNGIAMTIPVVHACLASAERLRRSPNIKPLLVEPLLVAVSRVCKLLYFVPGISVV